MHEQRGQQLIDAFYKALGLMQLEQCQEQLQELEDLAQQEPAYQGWCTLFTGLLANYRDRDWAEGERLFQALLQTDPEPALRGRVLISLGVTYRHQGRWHEAMKAYEQCLTVFSRPDQAVDRAKVWKNMAIILDLGFSQGEFDQEALRQAVKHCQSALEVLQVIKHPNEEELWLEATTWNTLGLVYRSLGDWPQATHCFERRIALGHALDDRYGIGAANHNLGEVLQHQGPAKWQEAQQAYLKALDIYRESHDQYNEIDVLANLGFLYQEIGQHEPALDYYSQAIQLSEGLRGGVTSEEARAGFFATIIDTYANAVLLCLAMGNQAQAFDYVERARSRAFLDVLVAGSLALPREMEARTITLAEVQADLPADALLLEYFTTGLEEARLDPAASRQGIQRHRFPPAKTLVFAITRDEVQVHDSGFSPNDLRPRQLDSAIERHFLGPQIRRTLYERLIAPVEELLQGERRVYLVPHGPLHYIPFQALIAADGDTLLREEGPQLVYAPSATLLFRYGQREPSQAPAPCLALGYNGEGERALRFAEEEAHSVVRLTGGQALAGPELKRAALYNQARDYRLLHFSCHGDFDPESPLASALHLAPDEALTALDVLEHLHLRCDLVTLSACESGLSRVRRGDELVGFMRAFMYAGAPALIASLWRVDERSTRILMERFYQEVQSGVGFAEALKRAQLYVRDLTRQEVLDHLVRFLADEILDTGTPASENRSDLPGGDVALQQVSAYLKGLATKGEGDEVRRFRARGDEERIFAEPYYWAPFILVGDHGSVSLEGE
jgi:CHAT domain-containing protein/tetratricopeptide (TPR) repeat protein